VIRLVILAVLLLALGVVLGAVIERRRTRMNPKRYADMEDFVVDVVFQQPTIDPRDIVVLPDPLKERGLPLATAIEADRTKRRVQLRRRGY
jgi:hypothetical protein